jgi:hypothetical protein
MWVPMRLFLRALPLLTTTFALACSACSKEPDKSGASGPSAATASASAGGDGGACEAIKGTWRVEGFAARSSGRDDVTLAETLTAAMDERARVIRIAYTGTRVKSWSPNSLMISNAYEIKEQSKTRCVLDVRGERNVLEVVDPTHVLLERPAANVGAKMRLYRWDEPAPEVGPK